VQLRLENLLLNILKLEIYPSHRSQIKGEEQWMILTL